MKQGLQSKFAAQFGIGAEYLFSAPGRTELGGNHTDHQQGKVLAAAVNLDTVAAVAETDTGVLRVQSVGYPLCEIALDDLTLRPEEMGTTAALIRGVAARFVQLGKAVHSFDALVESTVLPGSGLSSSAAFEVLIGVILNHLGGYGFSPEELAQIGQYAENVYFGKPCGLMDQMASAVGGIVGIDFADPARPVVEHIPFDFTACGHALCIIDTGASHSDLTEEYAAIPVELKAVCACFGEAVLRQVPEEEFYARLPAVRAAAGDRAVLRAIHVYEDNRRVERETQALKAGDFSGFLQAVKDSGHSSWMYLQNIVPAGRTRDQAVGFALALTEKLLQGKGASRVHGGGFAGTIQAFVPNEMLDSFRAGLESVLGAGCCHVLSIRPQGGVLLEDLR